MTMRAMYAFDRSLHDPRTVVRLLHRAAGAGITTLVTKAAAVTPQFADRCHRAGLRVLGSLACYSDHAEPLRRSHLHPVDETGTWAPMEWYTGLVPTDSAYNDLLVNRCAELAGRDWLDGLVLDFLRWPLHWELELRPGATPRHSSFDPGTLAALRRDTGIDVPPSLLLGPYLIPWYAWREQTITTQAGLLAAAVRRTRSDAVVGMFLVPGDAAQRRLVGQDVTALGAHVDMFYAMTYHRILRQPAQWIADVTADLRTRTVRPVVPMVQTTADPVLARGADWGEPLDEAEFAKALATVDGPVCVFPAEGMDDPRWLRLAATDVRSS